MLRMMKKKTMKMKTALTMKVAFAVSKGMSNEGLRRL